MKIFFAGIISILKNVILSLQLNKQTFQFHDIDTKGAALVAFNERRFFKKQERENVVLVFHFSRILRFVPKIRTSLRCVTTLT